MIRPKYYNCFSKDTVKLLSYSSSFSINHVKILHDGNDAIGKKYYSFSNYEKLLILLCWEFYIDPVIVVDIFKSDPSCNDRTMRSITSQYTYLSNNTYCSFKNLYPHSYDNLSSIIFDTDTPEEDISNL